MLKGVEVQGLREFSRALKKADRDLPKEMRAGLNDIARTVSEKAKSSVPKRSGRLANSIRPTSTPKMGRVSMGGARVPYAGFIEFGGRVGRGKSVVRAFVKDGRYLRPAYEASQQRVRREMEDLLERIVKKL